METGQEQQQLGARLAAQALADRRLAFLSEMFERFPDGEWFVVGGAVRDMIMGRDEIKDYDLVVRHVGLEELSEALSESGHVDLVGRSFGVLKYRPKDAETGEESIDIAWPRTEKAGMSGGYRDFTVQSDSEMAIEKDLARRDFTMNAIALDLRNKQLIDPHGGMKDIGGRVIRAVGEPAERFKEDYSRILRGLRFACQLGFLIEAATWENIKRQAHHLNDVRAVTVPPGAEREERVVPFETVARELAKAMAADPVRCVELFETSGLLFKIIPELVPLSACAQPRNQHSEGDVWAHTKLAISRLMEEDFKRRFGGERWSAETALAVLLHDIGKPQTRAVEGDKVTFYGHPDVGAAMARHIAERLKLSSVPDGGIDADRLAWLVKMHLFPNMLDITQVKKTTLFKHFLADRVAGRELLHLAHADASGAIPEHGQPDLSNLDRTMAAIREIEKLAASENGKPPKLLSGEDVMALTGIGPGPEIGKMLDLINEKHLNGELTTHEQAVEFIREMGSKVTE